MFITKVRRASWQIKQAAENIAQVRVHKGSPFFRLPPEICEHIATFAVEDRLKNIETDSSKMGIAHKAFTEEVDRIEKILSRIKF